MGTLAEVEEKPVFTAIKIDLKKSVAFLDGIYHFDKVIE